jgi:hypothetical protein
VGHREAGADLATCDFLAYDDFLFVLKFSEMKVARSLFGKARENFVSPKRQFEIVLTRDDAGAKGQPTGLPSEAVSLPKPSSPDSSM